MLRVHPSTKRMVKFTGFEISESEKCYIKTKSIFLSSFESSEIIHYEFA